MTTTTVPATSEITDDTDDTVAESTPTRRPRGRHALVALAAVALSILSVVGVAGTAEAATGRTGVHYVSSAACKGISPVMASQSQVVVQAPTIYAANTTSGLDGQTVRFRQRLLRWNGSTWVAAGQSAVWSGFATDSTAGLDFSDGSRTLRRPQITFTAGKGSYAVVTDYWWAATNYTTGGSNSANAYHSPSSNTTYCTFAA